MLRCSIHIGSVICNLPHRSIEVEFNKYMLLRRSILLLNLYILVYNQYYIIDYT